ncbi:hypothetical protein ACO2Q3_18560 [Caulobacter sp. KR2-114]|uniref:hypothetical protein n=1 Tax=Caulobacter sp. KR2-114 TaxID=3400912 RepID=UPI003BFC1202
MWVIDLLRLTPTMFKQSWDFYIDPYRFLHDRRFRTRPTVVQSFAMFSALATAIIVASYYAQSGSQLGLMQGSYAPHLILVNGAQTATTPHVQHVEFLGGREGFAFRVGVEARSLSAVPWDPPSPQPCAVTILGRQTQAWMNAPRSRLHSDATINSLTQAPIDERDAKRLDSLLRSQMNTICGGKNYAYGVAEPDFYLLGYSRDLEKLFRQRMVITPWTRNFTFEPMSLLLNFGLLSIDLAGVDPTQRSSTLYLIFWYGFLLTGGLAAALSFAARGSILDMARDGANIALISSTIPTCLSLIFLLLQLMVGDTHCRIGTIGSSRAMICSGTWLVTLFSEVLAGLMAISLARLAWYAGQTGLPPRKIARRSVMFILLLLTLWSSVLPVVDTAMFLYAENIERFFG